ncbi:MAG TPA: NADH-quinone oxidoreductase subunit N, partial [Bacteroidales bacterium]|nr:NADH-quinone oxidoreductase subunit N [Bacteroidales bacterium]
MNLETIMIMRHEILLVIAILLVLIGEISNPKNKSNLIHFAIGLFAIVTAVGFLPIETGKLFGGMYQTTNLVILFKNILNIGTLIILLQAANWLRKPENEYHTSEFFLIIFSTLLGMQYMVSSGDFLMFYLGLETATIPLAALAAFDRHKSVSAEAGAKLILSSALSSGILLFGLSLMYGINGSLYFENMAATVSVSPLMTLAFIFFFAG